MEHPLARKSQRFSVGFRFEENGRPFINLLFLKPILVTWWTIACELWEKVVSCMKIGFRRKPNELSINQKLKIVLQKFNIRPASHLLYFKHATVRPTRLPWFRLNINHLPAHCWHHNQTGRCCAFFLSLTHTPPIGTRFHFQIVSRLRDIVSEFQIRSNVASVTFLNIVKRLTLTFHSDIYF